MMVLTEQYHIAVINTEQDDIAIDIEQEGPIKDNKALKAQSEQNTTSVTRAIRRRCSEQMSEARLEDQSVRRKRRACRKNTP